jgi:PAS domain S-box-containing protein
MLFKNKAVTVPIVLFLSFTGINLLLWQFLYDDQRQGIREATQITATQAAIRLQSALAVRLSMVRHLRNHWLDGTISSRANFTQATHDIHDTFAGSQAVTRVDADGTIRWIEPEAGNRKAIGVNIRKLGIAAVAFEAAKRTGQPQSTSAINLVQGGKGFVVHFPLGAAEQFKGTVGAVFRIPAIVEEALGVGIADNYAVSITEDETTLYQSDAKKSANDPLYSAYSASHSARLLDRQWRVTLHPNIATIARGTRESLPLVFALALLLSALLAWVLHRHLMRQEALRDSEQLFKDFAQSGTDFYWETDENYCFVPLTDRMRDGGMDPSRRIGQTRWDITHERDTDTQKWRDHKADFAAHRPIKDFRHITLDQNGNTSHTLVSGVPIFNPDGSYRGHRGTSSNVTSIIKAEVDLLRSEENLANAQRIAHLGSWEWHIPTGKRHWSDETFRIFGFEPGDFVPSHDPLSKLIHPQDQQHVWNTEQGSQAGQDFRDIEFRIIRPDGTIRHVHSRREIEYDADGKPQRLSGTIHDITELKDARLLLEESEQRFKGFASSGSDWLWEMDAVLRFTNISGPIKFSSRSEGDHVGKYRWDFAADEDTDDDKWRAHKADLEARRPFRDFQYSVYGRKDEIVYGRASGVPVFDKDDTFTGYRGTGRDVTEIVHAEEGLRASQAFTPDQWTAVPLADAYADKFPARPYADLINDDAASINQTLWGLAPVYALDTARKTAAGIIGPIEAAGTKDDRPEQIMRFDNPICEVPDEFDTWPLALRQACLGGLLQESVTGGWGEDLRSLRSTKLEAYLGEISDAL